MSKMEAKRELKRQAILEAAEQAFLTDGYSDANMDAIAAQAGVTKQTVYRYYPSKADLFRETLKAMGARHDDGASDLLDLPDTQEALRCFAISFMQAHLSKEHLCTFRLLVSESVRAPEMIQAFFSVGPAGTEERLRRFFTERLHIQEPAPMIRLWTAMLFAFQDEALLDVHHPTKAELEEHATRATQVFLSGVTAQS
ncbi:TetR/AcrR family transcriptional regulator [Ruegeria arenilitoris]|uniref:TetR/AcrR family transcriptional regulator n=1 Tax=Ruegeria arenilitoris TaxID=1173585 RepID=UPI00147AA204|nr:TetR/AcrR family transcriptional regulator [Ruegeria arenilitoris]